MLDVKNGDIVLVPRLPSWGYVAVVEATTDWKGGYSYDIHKEKCDYGHIFPAKYLRKFRRSSAPVSGQIRSTLRTPMRFWNINYCGEHVNRILSEEPEVLDAIKDEKKKLDNLIQDSFNDAFDKSKFESGLVTKLNEGFSDKDWEKILVKVFENRYPSADVENVGGQKEKLHGTDILIKIPSPVREKEYAIAVQVKDWAGKSNEYVIDQIEKADYWKDKDSGYTLIDKIVIFVRSSAKENAELIENSRVKRSNISFVWKEDLQVLLAEYGRTIIELND